MSRSYMNEKNGRESKEEETRCLDGDEASPPGKDVDSQGPAHEHRHRFLKRGVRICLPFVLGGAILYFMYRDIDWTMFVDTLGETRWGWLLLSLVPGMLAQVLRGIRWKLALRPLGESSRLSHCVWAVFMSYAVSLVIPRVGEVARCGILNRYDKTSFTRSLGTVVTERLVDIVILFVLICAVFLLQIPVITKFFSITGVNVNSLTSRFTGTSLWIAIIVIVLITGLLIFCFRRFPLIKSFKRILQELTEGLLSLRKVNLPVYFSYSVATWLCYFFHYAITLLCFDFTAGLSPAVALVSFCVGTIAVIIPTPNGAGPWHFAVATVLVLYGVSSTDARSFALIVHLVQTLLLIVLGVIGWLCFLVSTSSHEKSLER